MIKLANILNEIVVKPSRSGTVALMSPEYTDKSHVSNKPARTLALEYLSILQDDYENDGEDKDRWEDYSPQIVRWDNDLYSVCEYYPSGEMLAESYFIGPKSDLYDLALRQFDSSDSDDASYDEAMLDFANALQFKEADTYTIQNVDQML